MRPSKSALLLLLTAGLSGAQANTAGTREKHHNHTAILDLKDETHKSVAQLQGEIDGLKLSIESIQKQLEATTAAIKPLQESGFTSTELKMLQQNVERHNLYFGILTAMTSIILVAVVTEVFKRFGDKRQPLSSH